MRRAYLAKYEEVQSTEIDIHINVLIMCHCVKGGGYACLEVGSM